MKNEELIKAMSDIDDEYIEEASQAEKKKGAKASSFVKGRKWTKWAGAVAAVLVLALVGTILFPSGMDSAKKQESMGDDSIYYTSDYNDYEVSDASYYSEGLSLDGRKNAAPQSANAGSSGGSSMPSLKPETEGSSQIYNGSKVKLIYRASVTAQTVDFAAADAQLRDMVTSAGGYFEGQSISNGTYYNGDYLKKASYTIRIPAEKFEDFLNGLKDGITVKSVSQTAEDVGLQYSETEQRLETLKIKLGRLQDLLRQASNMSDIIELENAISNTEADIEYYTNTINRYDSLIGFSTINLDLTEVARPGSGIEEKEGFFKKLGREFVEGLANAGENVADLFYWISYNFIGLLIFAAIAFCLIKFRPFTKLFKKIFKKN